MTENRNFYLLPFNGMGCALQKTSTTPNLQFTGEIIAKLDTKNQCRARRSRHNKHIGLCWMLKTCAPGHDTDLAAKTAFQGNEMVPIYDRKGKTLFKT